MMRILLRFWPVLLPLAMYLFWIWQKRNVARARGEDVPALTDGPLLWAGIATLLLLVSCFLWTGLTAEPVQGTYIAPHMENGRIAPARVMP